MQKSLKQLAGLRENGEKCMVQLAKQLLNNKPMPKQNFSSTGKYESGGAGGLSLCSRG
jgi:hypothetical protein